MDAGIETKPEFLAPLAGNPRIVAGIKRTNDQEVQCESSIKKPHLNGDTNLKSNEDETPDESELSRYNLWFFFRLLFWIRFNKLFLLGNVKASSSAANLYAALAADVLGDIDGMEEDEVAPPPPPPPAPIVTPASTSFPNLTAGSPVVEPHQQLYITGGPNSRQILVATSPSGALASRAVSIMGAGGQQYIMTPQTHLVQVSCVIIFYLFLPSSQFETIVQSN